MTAGSTYTPIATYTFSGQSSLTFSSIPNTYTDLILIISGSGAGVETMQLRFNGDSGSNYSYTRILGTGSSASSSQSSNQTAAIAGFMDNTQFVDIVQIMNYSNTTSYKIALTRMNVPSSGYVGAWVNLWRNTSAINTVYILPDSGGTFNNGKATLYGIASA